MNDRTNKQRNHQGEGIRASSCRADINQQGGDLEALGVYYCLCNLDFGKNL